MTDHQKLIHFLDKHNLAALATFGEEYPEVAIVEFANDDLEIIIDTHDVSRKYANIRRNPKVSLAIGWDDDITIQYEGVAEELRGGELQACQQTYIDKIPQAAKWARTPGVAFFLIKPTWIRLTDLNQHPWKVEEFTF